MKLALRLIKHPKPGVTFLVAFEAPKKAAQTVSNIADITAVGAIVPLMEQYKFSTLTKILAWSSFSAITGERQREVGILRAIGAKKSHIIKFFDAYRRLGRE